MTPCVLLAAYATGIVMVHVIAPWSLTGYVVALGFLLLLWVVFSRSRLAWLPFLALLITFGFMQASLTLKPPSSGDHVSQFTGTEPTIFESEILSVEKRPAGGYRLLTEVHKIIRNGHSAKIKGNVLLYIKEGELKAKPGQIIRWRSSLRTPSRFGNPGEFNYPLYLAARGIYTTGFIRQAEEIAVLINHPETKSTFLENQRLSLSTHIEETVPLQAAGLLQSLLLGLRGGISDDQRQVLSSSGVAHLFAISGLHFGLLAMLLYQSGKWLYTRSIKLILWCPPQRILPVLLIFPLAAYLLLTGNAWATQRAFLMASVFALLFASGRRTPTYALLASVAFCLLLFNPLALFQPGFQLSFSGVAGILIWHPVWQGYISNLSKTVRWPLTLFLTTCAATIATAPACLWHFHQFAPAGLLTNFIAIPLIAWGVVPLGLLSLATLPFSAALADLGLLLSAKIVILAIDLVTKISQWPWLKPIQFYLTTANLIFLIGTILVFLPLGKTKRHWFYRGIIVLTTLSLTWLTQPRTTDFQVTVFSVGQGDATLISFPNDQHFLIDGGGLPGSTIDPGEQLTGPALGRMGVKSLKGVILTHNHPDHSSGLVYILNRFPVEKFYCAESETRIFSDLQKILHEKDVAFQQLDEGWTYLKPQNPNNSFTLSLFTPSQKSPDKNERSVVVYAGKLTQGVLLTADLVGQGLEQLLKTSTPGPVTLLKLPHHGSRHAEPERYLEWSQPSSAFVSAGRNNPYGFPHQQVLDAFTKKRIPLFRTDQDGMLTFHIKNDHWQEKSQKPL